GFSRDWSSDVCSSDLGGGGEVAELLLGGGDLPGEDDLVDGVGGGPVEEVGALLAVPLPAGRLEDLVGVEVQLPVEGAGENEARPVDLGAVEDLKDVG